MHFFNSVIVKVLCSDHIEIVLLSWGISATNM
jgi:hypothetical protein